jgi:prepilin-type N-terminal cleavage/methylation domain-containing protein
MQRKRFLLKLRVRNSTAGFSLVELLVTLLISGIMMTVTAGYFRTIVAARHNTILTAEAGQGLRSLIQEVTQELRQAGACLTQLGPFISLEGVNSGTRDSLTLRIGRTNSAGRCIQAGIAAGNAGATVVQVTNASIFSGGQRVYIVTPNNVNGAFYVVTGASGTSLTLSTPLVNFGGSPSYVGAGIYPIEQRTYAIDASDIEHPMLTVSIDGGSPVPLVEGVDIFDVKYRLGPCEPGCAGGETNLPATQADWRLVRDVKIKATIKSHDKNRNGNYEYVTTGRGAGDEEYVTVKPRNLL